MLEISEEVNSIFNHIEQNKCLCSCTSFEQVKHLWNRLYEYCFENSDGMIKEDNQLLCISFVRLVGEIYTENQYVCSNIHQLFESFLTEDFWKIFVYHLKNMENKYLTWVVIKSACIIVYSCSEPVFCERIHKLLDVVEKDPLRDKNKNFLDFLSHLVDYQQSKNVCLISTCQNAIIRSVLPFKDLFQRLLQLLSEYWSSFENHFNKAIATKCENLNINGFLIVWQKLVVKLQDQELLNKFLDQQSVIPFLSNAYNLSVISLRIYTDIIMQILISNVKSFEENYSRSVEAAIKAAFDKDIFTLLPHDYQISGLCKMTNSNEDESTSHSNSSNYKKCDSVIAKKTVFIFLILIADSKDKNLLCSSLSRILDFVKRSLDDDSPDTNAYEWILDDFIDQDDILLGVMFALLKIYTVLKEDKIISPDCVPLVNSINPHEIFISFLQRMGFDHSELLSFLLSDETCFLVYLLKYLKLLLSEWDLFVEAHATLIKGDEDMSELDDSGSQTDEEPSVSVSYEPPAKKLLVSYSSSSSDDDHYIGEQDRTKCDIKKSLTVIVTLSKLKTSIKKLVDADEFPFNVSPLVAMLQACEDCCL